MHRLGEGQDTFPVVRVGEIPRDESQPRWLVEGLWGPASVGFVAGHPKACKSWLGLDIAVSVATGLPCLGRFRVTEPGRALIYLAEDSLPMVRERVAALARHRGLALEQVDLHVITAPELRLDLAEHCVRLQATVQRLRPRLVLLDPLVRLHRLDENRSADIAGLLSHLRALQRAFQVAVLVVHHTRKNEVGGGPAGQGLRGSGDLWAWSDSTLYIRRVKGKLRLSMEHRAAAAPDAIWLRLADEDQERLHLEVIDGEVALEEQHSLVEAVMEALSPGAALTRTELRDRVKVKNERLGEALVTMEREGLLTRGPGGRRLALTNQGSPPHLSAPRNGAAQSRSDSLGGG
jgi:hypothetical protein